MIVQASVVEVAADAVVGVLVCLWGVFPAAAGMAVVAALIVIGAGFVAFYYFAITAAAAVAEAVTVEASNTVA